MLQYHNKVTQLLSAKEFVVCPQPHVAPNHMWHMSIASVVTVKCKLRAHESI